MSVRSSSARVAPPKVFVTCESSIICRFLLRQKRRERLCAQSERAQPLRRCPECVEGLLFLLFGKGRGYLGAKRFVFLEFAVKRVIFAVKLLGLADGILGAVLGCMIAALTLMLLGSLVKVFFGNSDAYNASRILKFFGNATLGDLFGWLNIGHWIDKLNS